MALRISVDVDGMRWADLFRFVDLARRGGVEPDDQVDVVTYGSDPLAVSLSGRIFLAEDFASDSVDNSTAPLPRSGPAGSAAPGSAFGYDGPAERAPAVPSNGSHYGAFDTPPDRGTAAAPGGSAFAAYQNQPDRPSPQSNGSYNAFEAPERNGSANGQAFSAFEPAFERNGKDSGGSGPAESPYLEEFARLQEGLMRPVVRRDDDRS